MSHRKCCNTARIEQFTVFPLCFCLFIWKLFPCQLYAKKLPCCYRAIFKDRRVWSQGIWFPRILVFIYCIRNHIGWAAIDYFNAVVGKMLFNYQSVTIYNRIVKLLQVVIDPCSSIYDTKQSKTLFRIRILIRARLQSVRRVNVSLGINT